MKKRTLIKAAAVLALASSFTAGVLAQDKPLKIGVTAGPHAQIAEGRQGQALGGEAGEGIPVA